MKLAFVLLIFVLFITGCASSGSVIRGERDTILNQRAACSWFGDAFIVDNITYPLFKHEYYESDYENWSILLNHMNSLGFSDTDVRKSKCLMPDEYYIELDKYYADETYEYPFPEGYNESLCIIPCTTMECWGVDEDGPFVIGKIRKQAYAESRECEYEQDYILVTEIPPTQRETIGETVNGKKFFIENNELWHERWGKVDLDRDSFEILSPSFFKDKNAVYYVQTGTRDTYSMILIESADPATFVLGYSLFVAMDKNAVYYMSYSPTSSGSVVRFPVDMKTFEYLGNGTYQDASHTYVTTRNTVSGSSGLVIKK